MMKLTFSEFTRRAGFLPFDDDLERANCDKAGDDTHTMCGWCDDCNKPVFICGHMKKKALANESTRA